MRVLFVSHTSVVGGAEHWLLELLKSLGPDVFSIVACPPGDLQRRVASAGISVHHLPGTEGSLRFHPWHTGRSVFELAWAGAAIRRLARRLDVDVVHANSLRAGLAAAMAARLGGPQTVVQVHDCLPPGPVTNLIHGTVRDGAAVVVANSRYTARRFAGSREHEKLEVSWNPVDLDRFDPASWSRTRARDDLHLGAETHALGVVAQLTPWKGQDDAIKAAALSTRAGFDVRLFIVGKAKFTAAAGRYDNRSYEQYLRRLVREEGVEDVVAFLGERDDVPAILSALDLLLVPSWEEPFGRIAAEGMAMALPVIATSLGGPAEFIEDGRDGLLLPPRQPDRWSAAICELLSDHGRRAEMGQRARHKARRSFRAEDQAARMTDVFRRLVAERISRQ
jgi:glycosyltransferase involved in cell wall biosynthesis